MKEYIVTEHPDFPYEEPKPQELIRCKDCVNCGTDDCAMRFETDDKVYQWNCADDFCSWGKREEEW